MGLQKDQVIGLVVFALVLICVWLAASFFAFDEGYKQGVKVGASHVYSKVESQYYRINITTFNENKSFLETETAAVVWWRALVRFFGVGLR